MKRRSFLSATLGLSALGATLASTLSGCGSGGGTTPFNGAFSGGGGVSPAPPPNPAGRGAAEGTAYLSPDGNEIRFFATANDAANLGWKPAAGLRAEIVGGGPSTIIGTDGLLRLAGIESGLRTLRISAPGRALPRDLPLTVPPNATLPLAETPITREQAVEAALTQLGNDYRNGTDILASSTPMPAGVVVQSAFNRGGATLQTENTSWIVYVDAAPILRFGHETVAVAVDAQTGVARVLPAQSWPLLNGASFYGDAVANAGSPDAVLLASSRAAQPKAASTAAAAALSASRAAPPAPCRAADPEKAKTHMLIVQGVFDADMDADYASAAATFQRAPFPAPGVVQKLVTWRDNTSEADLLRAFAAVRDAAGSGDTVVIYFVSHGHIPNEEMTNAELFASYRCVLEGRPSSDGSEYEEFLFNPASLDFSGCKACRIIVIADTCYSGNWIPILRPQLVALEKKDIQILTATDNFRPGDGEIRFPVTLGGATFNRVAGGPFTQFLFAALARVPVPDNGGSTDALEAAFALAEPAVFEHGALNVEDDPAGNRYSRTRPQLSQKFRRPLGEDDVCGEGAETVSVQ